MAEGLRDYGGGDERVRSAGADQVLCSSTVVPLTSHGDHVESLGTSSVAAHFPFQNCDQVLSHDIANSCCSSVAAAAACCQVLRCDPDTMLYNAAMAALRQMEVVDSYLDLCADAFAIASSRCSRLCW